MTTITQEKSSQARIWDILRFVWRYGILWLGLAILLVFLMMILFAPQIATHNPTDQDLLNRLAEPSDENWFGTDELGRDVYSRVVYGARVTLPAAVAVVLSTTIIGTLMGAIAGYFGGYLGGGIMRVADLTLAFPGIVLALAIAAMLGPSLENMLIAACIVLWPEYARLMRSRVIVIRSQEYVVASRSIGASNARILLRHILPNSWTPIFIKAALDMGNILLLISALSFFGLGVDPTEAEWGSMIAQGQAKFFEWWIATFPGLAIFSVILGFNLLSEGLRDLLDPNYK